MLKRNLFRDLAIYTFTSIRFLLIKGQLNLFVKDLSYFKQWRKYRLSEKGTIDYRIPWLVFSCISFLDKWLRKDMNIFEYGSGGSTLYFAEKALSIVSVEHDAAWYAYAQKEIERSGYLNIKYKLVEPKAAPDAISKDCSMPFNYVSCFSEYKGYEFTDYATTIDNYEDGAFDLVIVDGRVRHSCIAHAMQKVKLNGALLLDNADRTYYLHPFPELTDQAKWKLVNFVGHFPYGPASVVNTTKLFIKVS
jgi:hypothetical protein